MQGTRLRFLLRKHAVMALPKNKRCLKSEPSFGPSLPASPTFIRSSREPCTHASTPAVVVIQTHPPGPDSGQRELCQSSRKKTKCIHSFTSAEHSLCARHCLRKAGVTTIPMQRTRSRQRVQHGVGGAATEKVEKKSGWEGAQRGLWAGASRRAKALGRDSVWQDRPAGRQDVQTMGGDPGESRAPRSRQGANHRTLHTTFRGSGLEPGPAQGTCLDLFFHFCVKESLWLLSGEQTWGAGAKVGAGKPVWRLPAV